MKKVTLILLAILGLTGCNQDTQIDQSKICVVNTDAEAKQCKDGEMILFKPGRWGNEQLPLNIAAAYCDFNHEVMFNNSGVICVFTDKRLSLVN